MSRNGNRKLRTKEAQRNTTSENTQQWDALPNDVALVSANQNTPTNEQLTTDSDPKKEEFSTDEQLKFLYSFSLEVAKEEQSRSGRLDQKASWYLGVLAFMFAVASFFAKALIDKIAINPPTLPYPLNPLIVKGVIITAFVGIMLDLYVIFSILKVNTREFFTLGEDTIKFFKNSDMNHLNEQLAKQLATVKQHNEKINDRKSNRLIWAYWLLFITSILIIAMIVCYFFAA